MLASHHDEAGASSAALAAAGGVPVDLRNIDEAARVFNVTAPTVRGWIVAGCPVFERGKNGVGYKLSLRAVAAWRQDRDAAAAEIDEAKARQDAQLRMDLLGGESLAGEEAARLTPKQQADALTAELARIKLAKERRELVRADTIQLELNRAFTLIRDRVRAMPDAIAAALGWGDDETTACLEAVDNLLEEMAADAPKLLAEMVDHAAAA